MEFNKRIEEMKDELICSTQEILKIKSVEEDAMPLMPFGEGVDKSLKCALSISERLGFKTKNLDGYIGYAEYGEGDDYVAVLGHLDVVPEGAGWKYPPYGAEIHDDKIYARGTLDDKGPMIAALYALKAVKDSKVPLSKRIRIIFGTNEETGSKEMGYYLKKEKPPVAGFTPDGDFPLIYAEKGMTIFNIAKDLVKKPLNAISIKYINGGQRANMVPDYCEAGIIAENENLIVEKARMFAKKTGYDIGAVKKDGIVVVTSAGVSAHGSVPEDGKNAIMHLFAFLGSIELGESDIKDFISFCNKYIGMETTGDSFGVGLKDEDSGCLSFNTGMVMMNEDKIILVLNLRYPVTFTYDDMMNPFNERLSGTGIYVENMEHQKPLYFPKDHELIKILLSVFKEHTGIEAKPLAIGGGTYAKEMPNIVAFGPIFPGKPDLDHQVNEYIEIQDLILNAKIYASAIYELAK